VGKKPNASGRLRAGRVCCACGSSELAPGILRYNRPVILAAFPDLRPRKQFPLCSPCRAKIRWVVEDEDDIDTLAVFGGTP
jgi:hypothetical protein